MYPWSSRSLCRAGPLSSFWHKPMSALLSWLVAAQTFFSPGVTGIAVPGPDRDSAPFTLQSPLGDGSPGFLSDADKLRDIRTREEALIHNMLKLYTQEHTRSTYQVSKGFVVGAYGCPGQFGNRMHEFLNAFALAVITDRTLVWRYTNQATGVHEVGSLAECSKYMSRRDWIPSVDVLKESNAEIIELNWESAVEVACGRLHEKRAKAIAPGKKLEQYQVASLAQSTADISHEMATRAKRLMARGPEFLYGKLFEAAFYFTNEVVGPTRDVLQEARLIDESGRRTPPDALWLGAHIRHKNIEDTVEERRELASKFAEAVGAVVNNSKSGVCAVLLATDDDVTEDLLKPFVERIRCSMVRSKMGEPRPDFKDEHGNNTGVGAMRDLYLLSRADVLVGTGFSSFTMAISEQLRSSQGSTSDIWRCLDSKKDLPCRLQSDTFDKMTNVVQIQEGTCEGRRGHKTLELNRDVHTSFLAKALIEREISGFMSDNQIKVVDSSEKPVVVGQFAQPLRPATMLRELANAFAVAIITGRGLVWESSVLDTTGIPIEDDEQPGVSLQEWVPSTLVNNGSRRNNIAGAGDLACTSLDSDSVLDISGFGTYEAEALVSSSSLLSPEMRQRADALFALGPEYLYGRLIQSAFNFDHVRVIAPVSQTLREAGLLDDWGRRTQTNATWVSVVAHHKASSMTGEERSDFARLLWNETERIIDAQQSSSCVVLLVSDDEVTEAFLRPFTRAKGCTMVTSAATTLPVQPAELLLRGGDVSDAPDGYDVAPNITTLPKGGRTRLNGMRDIYFLSFADAIVGTAWSGFTQTIAEMILAHNPNAPYVQCMTSVCTQSREWFARSRAPTNCDEPFFA